MKTAIKHTHRAVSLVLGLRNSLQSTPYMYSLTTGNHCLIPEQHCLLPTILVCLCRSVVRFLHIFECDCHLFILTAMSHHNEHIAFSKVYSWAFG